MKNARAFVIVSALVGLAACDVETGGDFEEITPRGLTTTDGFNFNSFNGFTNNGNGLAANGLTGLSNNGLQVAVVHELQVDDILSCYCITQSLIEGRATFAPICCVDPHATWE